MMTPKKKPIKKKGVPGFAKRLVMSFRLIGKRDISTFALGTLGVFSVLLTFTTPPSTVAYMVAEGSVLDSNYFNLGSFLLLILSFASIFMFVMTRNMREVKFDYLKD